MQVDVRMREFLNKFDGSTFKVFMAIALRTDSEGWCYPNISLIAANAGVSPDTVHKALNDLCKLTIEDSRVLMRVKAKQPDGKFANNRYLIFPTTEDLEKFHDTEVLPDTDLPGEDSIVDSKNKRAATVREEIAMPARPTGQSARDRVTELLTLYEQAKAQGKKLVYNGNEIRNTGIIMKLVEELYGKGWPVEYSYLNKMISQSGNHWRLVEYIFQAAATHKSGGNPWTYINGIVLKNKSSFPVFTEKKEPSAVLAKRLASIPGKDYERKLDTLSVILETEGLTEVEYETARDNVKLIYQILES